MYSTMIGKSVAPTGLWEKYELNHRAYALGYICATPFGG
jgi:hypothetical protein